MAQADGEVSDAEATFKQRRREVQCAVNLRDLLAPYNADDDSAFEALMRQHAAGLVTTPFGEELLHVIGYVYKLAGEKHLGRQEHLGFHGHLLSMQQKGHILGNQANLVGSGVRAWVSQRSVASHERKRAAFKTMKKAAILAERRLTLARPAAAAADDDAAAAANHDAAAEAPVEPPTWEAEADAAAEAAAAAEFESKASASQAKFMEEMLETVWHLSKLDIESTLRAATHKLLHDKSVDEAERNRRAGGLIVVGRIFEATECPEPQDGAETRSDTEADDGGSGGGGGGGGGGNSCVGGSIKTKRMKRTWRDDLRDQVRTNVASKAPK
jgi:hypothetical protein